MSHKTVLIHEKNEGVKLRVTVKEKILLYLMRYNVTPETGFTVVFDLTQDGIGGAIGITRSHVSVELKRMIEDNKVICWKAHLIGSSTKRLAYAITQKGLREAETILAILRENGVTPDMLLDMQNCNPQKLWNALDENDRNTLGMVCVLRKSIPRNDIPRMSVGTIPINKDGYVSFPKPSARNFLRCAPPSTVRYWHSWAADYWLPRGEYMERLYHLIMADRMKEASRCLSVHCDDFIDRADASTLKMVKKIVPDSDNAVDVYRICTLIALKINDCAEAGRLCAKLASVCDFEWKPLMAEIYRRVGRKKEAKELAEEALRTQPDAMAALVLARVAIDERDPDAAEGFLDSAALSVSRGGDTRLLEEIQRARSEVDDLKESPE